MNDIFLNLTDKQKQAVFTNEKAVRVIAGAGSGKTRVLTMRIAHLIKEGVWPESILAITFTNKAANEMKKRIETLTNNQASVSNISTFHSFCARVLRFEIHNIGYPKNFTIVDAEDQKTILKNIYKNLLITKNELSYSSALSYISNNKCAQISPQKAKEMTFNDFIEEKKADIYYLYEEYLRQQYCLDFDDLIIKTVMIFEKFENVLEKYSSRFKYILVDEFQDIDYFQYKLIKLLSKKHRCIYVVGDPDQTIYTWRGADVNIILNFEKDFDNCQTIVLDENFRSTKNILNSANSVIKNNLKRVEKALFTNNEEGEKVLVGNFETDDEEASFVADEIRKLSDEYGYEQIAVLYRANYQSRAIEKALIEKGLPYVIYGGIRFYERAEIKDVLCYLRMLATSDDLAFLRTINKPKRGIGEKALDDLRNEASLENLSLYEYLLKNVDSIKKKFKDYVVLIEELKRSVDKLSIEDLMNKVITDTGYRAMLETDNEQERLENIKELMNDINQYFKTHEEASLDEYLQTVSLFSDNDNKNEKRNISLMTAHSAKGLEYKVVFLIGMNDGVFPSERGVLNDPSYLEEERRLAYVAFTRARKILYICYAKGYSFITGNVRRPSCFIEEIDQDYLYYLNERASYGNFNNETNVSFNIPVSFEENFKKATRYKKGDILQHTNFGEGVVMGVEGDILKIAFEHPYGIKKIMSNHKSLRKVKK